MESLADILQILGVISIWIVVYWLSKLISTMKNGIEAQSNIINSFKGQSDYIDNVQNTLSKLYDPEEIEKIVKAKTEIVISKEKEEHEKSKEKHKKDLFGLYSFIARSCVYLDDSTIDEIFFKSRFGNQELEEFVRETRKAILEVRKEAILELKNET